MVRKEVVAADEAKIMSGEINDERNAATTKSVLALQHWTLTDTAGGTAMGYVGLEGNPTEWHTTLKQEGTGHHVQCLGQRGRWRAVARRPLVESAPRTRDAVIDNARRHRDSRKTGATRSAESRYWGVRIRNRTKAT